MLNTIFDDINPALILPTTNIRILSIYNKCTKETCFELDQTENIDEALQTLIVSFEKFFFFLIPVEISALPNTVIHNLYIADK